MPHQSIVYHYLHFIHVLLRDYFCFTSAIKMIGDVNVDIRRQAVWALGQLRDLRGATGLVGLLNDSEQIIRWLVPYALAQIDDPTTVPHLIAKLNDQSEDIQVRERIVESLGTIQSEQAINALVEATQSQEPFVREAALYFLKRTGTAARIVSERETKLADEYSRTSRPSRDKIGILLVDDIVETNDLLEKLLLFEPDFMILGKANNGIEAIALARDLQPDIVLMDVYMPILRGLEATEILHELDTRIGTIILTVATSEEYQRRAIRGGARAWLHKPASADQLYETIRRVYRECKSSTTTDRLQGSSC